MVGLVENRCASFLGICILEVEPLHSAQTQVRRHIFRLTRRRLIFRRDFFRQDFGHIISLPILPILPILSLLKRML